MKSIYAFARLFFGASACLLLLLSSKYSLDIPADLPGWRMVLGMALFCAAALVFEWAFNSRDKTETIDKESAP